MTGYRDMCCGCAVSGYPCTRCYLRNVFYMECDSCRADEKLYRVGDKELCADCVREAFDYVPEEDAYLVGGELVTDDELFEMLEVVENED